MLKERLDSTVDRLKMEKRMGQAKLMELETEKERSMKTTTQKQGFIIKIGLLLCTAIELSHKLEEQRKIVEEKEKQLELIMEKGEIGETIVIQSCTPTGILS